MNTKLSVFITAVLSGAVFGFSGFLVGKKLAEKKADEEIESIRAAQRDHDIWLKNLWGVKEENKVEEPEPEKAPAENNNNTMDSIKEATATYTYHDYTGKYSSAEPESKTQDLHSTVTVLSDEEFAESDNHIETLYYYQDGIVADEDGNVVKNFEDLIGDSLDIFRTSDDDCIHVRNKNTQTDYEILLSERYWYDDVATPRQKNSLIHAENDDD